MFSNLKNWVLENQTLVWWLFASSIATLIISIVVVPIIVSRMRPDYFVTDPGDSEFSLKNRHPALRLVGLILKNLFGGILVILGLVLSVPGVPGQGLLTILMGLVVMDFPGKKKIELALIRFKPVLKAVDWIRQRSDREPLQIPEK